MDMDSRQLLLPPRVLVSFLAWIGCLSVASTQGTGGSGVDRDGDFEKILGDTNDDGSHTMENNKMRFGLGPIASRSVSLPISFHVPTSRPYPKPSSASVRFRPTNELPYNKGGAHVELP